jgi:hypothetical protein
MDVAALIARYEAISQQEEAELLGRLTQSGWDAGCWVRPSPELILAATQEEIAAFLELLRSRPGFARESVNDPYPNGRHCEPIEGENPCYVVLSQRCDIIGLLKAEPLVELAPAVICGNNERIKSAWKNSPREFPIDSRANPTFLVDLRYRFFIAKPDLEALPVKQALPVEEPEYQVRLRFALRAAQRYTRAAVPDKLVEKVVGPLRELVDGDDEANKLFTEWALFHGGQREHKPGLIVTYRLDIDEALGEDEQAQREDEIREAAEDKFQSVINALPAEARAELDFDDDHRTRAISERDLTVADWRLSWKLEWDDVSFSGDPDAATPAR